MKNKLNPFLRMLCMAMMTLMALGMTAQERTVSGTVTDGQEPLIGVTVQVKGNSKVGTVTDVDGKYTLRVSSPGTILVYSYVGYQTQEKMVGSNSRIDVTLESDSKNLNEVVVIGYGTMKKSDLTGSVSQLNSADFKSGNQLSAQQLMQGAFAGVNIAQIE